ESRELNECARFVDCSHHVTTRVAWNAASRSSPLESSEATEVQIRAGATDHPHKLERELLFALNHGAVGRSCFPGPGIIDPSVAADYGPSPMRAPEFGVIGKRVM